MRIDFLKRMIPFGLLAIVAAPAAALTLSSPLRPGDVFGTHHTATALYQYRVNSVVSTITGVGFGGVASDTAGSLWFSYGDGTSENPFSIEMIPFGTTTSAVKISGADLSVPTGASAIRDIVLDSTGNLYAMFYGGSNSVVKYAPNGSGGFLAGVVLGSFGGSFADGGAGRLDLSVDEQYLVTGNRSTMRLHTMNTTDGVVGSAGPGASLSGGAQIGALGPDAVVFSESAGLSVTSFNPTTGATGTSSVRLVDPGAFVDGATYVPELGRTYFTYRAAGGTIRYATDRQLAAASANGVALDGAALPLIYAGSVAYVNRDLAVATPPPLAAPVGWGDLFIVDYSLRSVHQYRDGTLLGSLDFGENTLLGGVYSDRQGGVAIAGNGIGVYRVASGESQGQWLITPDQLGSGAVRDTVFGRDGSIYLSYLGDNGRVDKFTATADGYVKTTLGSFGIASGDYGNLHMWLTDNGKYLLTSGRGDNRIVAMSTADGSTTTWQASGFSLAAEMVLDPVAGDYIYFGTDITSGAQRLRGLAFDPESGVFGTETDILTSSQSWVDALVFDPQTGDLYMSVRNNQLRMATYEQLLAARDGTLIDIGALPLVVSSGLVQVARDMAITTVPEPGSVILLACGVLGFLAVRHRRRA